MSNSNNKGLLLPLLLLIFPAVASLRSISLSEFWIHIAQGQAGILRSETFSFASDSGSYVNVHWLYDLLIAGLFNSAGAGAVILLHTVAIVAAYGLLVLAARRYTSGFAVAFSIVITTWLIMVKLDARPIILAYPFIALMIYALEARPPRVTGFIMLGIGQWFWAGLHPSFILGPLLCAIYAFSHSREESGTPNDFKQGLIGAGIALGVSLLNPYGPGLHSWAIGHMPIQFMPISLTDLSSISDTVGADGFRMVLYLALAIGGAGLLTYRQKLPLAVTACAVVSAFMAVMAVGRISYHLLAIFGFMFFVISCQSIGEFIHSHLKGREKVADIAGYAVLGLLVLGTFFSLLTGGFFQSIGSASRLGLGLDQQTVSDDAIAFIGKEGFPETMINLPLDGGKLKAQLPDRKVYIDQRLGAYSNVQFTDINKALLRADKEVWDTINETYQPDAVLFNLTIRGSHAGVRMLLEQGTWRLSFFDGISAILIQNKPEWTDSFSNTDVQAKGLAQLEAAKNKTLAKLTHGALPPLPLQLIGAGNLLLALDRTAQANAVYELAYAALPSDMDLLHQLGVTRFSLKEYDRAAAAIQTVLETQPDNAITWLWLARVYEAQDRSSEAASAYNRGYSISPETADQVKKIWKLKSGV